MKYFPLVWAALRRKPIRTLVTFLSVTAAFTLFGLMIGLNDTLHQIEARARADRIWTVGRFNNFAMPITVARKVASLPGVKRVTVMSYLNGYVGDPKEPSGALMADDAYGAIFTDQLTPEGWDSIRRDHTSITMTRIQAEHFHKKVGDTFTLIAPQSVKADGSNVWTFKVGHISEDLPQVPLGFIAGSYDYYDRSMPLALQGTIAEVDSVVADPAKAGTISEQIDRIFANSANPTQSTPEKTILAVNSNSGGIDVAALTHEIALTGLLMILFLISNVIAQSVRERRAEFAALKTIGYSDGLVIALVAGEAALPCIAGAVCGVLVAAGLASQLPGVMPRTFGIPPPIMSPPVYLWALASACVMAVASTALPALRLSRQDIAAVLFGPRMTMLRQIVIVSLLGLRTLRQRLWQSLVLVVGMACVSGVLLSMLSMAEGQRHAYLNNGDPHSAIVVSRGTIFEILSTVPREQARLVTGAPGIARAPDGSPIVDSSLVTPVPALLRKNGSRAFIVLRSFGGKGQMLRPTFHLVAGRMFRPGTHELIAGTKASFQFQGMALGDKVILPDGEWPIVGTFTTGDLLDGQIVGDTETLMQSIRHKAYTIVLARLASPAAFAAFRKALTANPALSVDVMRLPDWNAKINADTSAFFHLAIYGIGVILAIGALFGCFNTMYAAVESRSHEIATLRALGYGGTAVTVSILLEAAMLSVAGSLIGASIAWALYDGVQSGFGSDVFTLTVSPAIIGMAMLWAIAVAFLGGILPSIQAARWTVSEALRAR